MNVTGLDPNHDENVKILDRMTDTAAATPAPTPIPRRNETLQRGLRKNGKSWHNSAPRQAFRPTSGQTSYSKRLALRQAASATKAVEREMKEEKDAQRARFIDGIREKRKKKEEKERFEKMEAKMHRKRVARLKRREKRNNLLGK